MMTDDREIDFWFYQQTLEIHLDLHELLEELIEWDKHRRIHQLAFRDASVEDDYHQMVLNTYSSLKALSELIRGSRGLIQMRWITLLGQVDRDLDKFAPMVELAISPF